MGFFKCNVDAAIFEPQNYSALAFVIHDHMGECKYAYHAAIPGITHSLMVEAIGFREILYNLHLLNLIPSFFNILVFLLLFDLALPLSALHSQSRAWRSEARHQWCLPGSSLLLLFRSSQPSKTPLRFFRSHPPSLSTPSPPMPTAPDDDFDFGVDGDGAFEAVGGLLVDSGCVEDYEEGRLVCCKISEKFGKHGLVKPKEAMRSLGTSLWMFDVMDDGEPVKKKVELLDGPVLTERDGVKLKRRKRKEER
ncbi:uncharacterized protein LOC120270360 [Dioscorea cayenensis subsp. rotundata]|uniref:Uncharacterized protein LOC120270360 n=1 Tax=Dioscorea cayennensis subsp. rotundata TaxID=55577 RepID=A0AB40C4H5_DIOCR|nr:uncharacterized protein LOC120270360 [Dioscorea cayenensis subsp. rotundata]